MALKKSPPLLSLALIILREKSGWTKKALAAAAGLSPKTVWAWENGDPAFTRQRLDELAAVMGLGPLRVEMALFAARIVDLELPPPVSLVDPSEEQRQIVEQGVAMGIQGFTDPLIEGLLREVREENIRQEIQLAEILWKQVEGEPREKRRSLLREDAAFHHWSVCHFLCDESARKAADDAGEARELAELAGIVVRQLREKAPDDRFLIRLEGRTEAFLGNALRVAGDHELAEAAFGLTRTLWKEGADEAGLLSEARILDLEASLRRDQRRFEAALRLHVQALEWANRAEEGAILLNQAGTFELKGQYARALAALDRAAPSIDGKRQPHLRWALRQNQALSLVRLCRAEEAQPAVAEALHLAQVLGNNLDLLRTRGLAALVDASLGKRKEAVESLEQVCRTFAEKGYVYDYALVGLDLALLYRGENLWAEIRELAGRMVEIFRERNIHRETIAALLLFREAAVKEAVNVELVRRLQDYLQQAQARPGVRFR